MNLHLDRTQFEQYIKLTAQHFGLLDVFVEKDYWLCSVLYNLAQHDYASLFVFKGGTSLAKAYGLIQRFSEDIDLALLSSGLSGNQAKSRIDKLSKDITQHLTEINVQGLTKKWSRFRKTFHQYPAVIPEVQGTQMAPFLLLELNSFGMPYPYQTMAISSLIADFSRGQ